MRTSFPQITEAALDVLEVKFMLLTKADITYWFITAACGVAQAKIASTEPDAQIQWVRDKIAKAYKKIFVSPQKSNGMRTSGEPIPEDDVDPGKRPVVGLLATPSPESSLESAVQPFETFDLLDMAEWNLDSLWPFDPFEL
ncbi:hypothetical protein MMC15_007675 [Xylographa vitiligo]|nr:hypothetical protein [Xylographa vitiligo]